MSALVEVAGLTAVAGDNILVDQVSFRVWPGEVTALVGASGSGKTTSALALLGEHGDNVRLTGRVEVDGTAVVDEDGPTRAAEKMRGRVVAYMPQHPGSALNPARRIGAVLRELGSLHHPGEEVVPEALRAAQLPADRATLRRFPHQFSGGQRQRIALAQALTCRPKALVLDEPSTGLDSITRLQLASELEALATAGLGILLLSHDLDLVRALAHHVVVLNAGQVESTGGPEVLRTRGPRRPLTSIARLTSPRAIAQDEPGAADRRLALAPESVDGVTAARAGADRLLLWASGLSAEVKRRTRVLDGVALTVSSGSCVGVVGRSGSGKTTLARCLAGLHERATGRIELDGQELPVLRKRTAEQVRRVQYVWQEVRGSFDERRTVESQVARTAERLRGLTREAAKAEAVAMLARLGVSAMTAARPPGQLSGGELQRAALARALLAKPELLICDEITTALDDRGTDLVIELLTELRAQGMGMIWISHDLALVASVAEHVLVLDAGHVVEQGPPGTVMTEPAADITRRLVEAANLGRNRPEATAGPANTVVPVSPPVLTSPADTRSESQR